MPKKSIDPFMTGLWDALIADKLGPGGHETGWDETPVRIRNRFTRAVRAVLQSGAALQASAFEMPGAARAERKTSGGGGKKTAAKRPDPRELHLPLMSSVQGKAGTAKKAR